jgi:hypothetical protein
MDMDGQRLRDGPADVVDVGVGDRRHTKLRPPYGENA